MNSYELLCAELKEKGFTNQSIKQSKILPAVLSIVAEDSRILELNEIDNELVSRKKQIERLDDDIWRKRNEVSRLEAIIKEKKATIETKIAKDYFDEISEKVDVFYKALEEGESPEGRDALKKAQLFIQSVNVDTKYDNTAYIIGLSAILSNSGISPICELQKINKGIPPKVRYPEETCTWY